MALFSFIGVECASIAAGRVKNPRKNVGRASILGTALSAMLYLAVTAAVMGLVSHQHLVGNGTPFVAAFQTMFGHAAWVGKAVAATAVVSGIGALNGWTLVTAEMPWAAAQDGLFLPQFAKVNRDGTPWFGILVSTLVASLLMAFAYSSKTGLTVFTYLVDLSVVTVAIPYFFSACAQLAYLVSRRRRVIGWLLARDLSIAGASVLFSLWVAFASGYQAVYQAMLLLLIGLPIYAFLKARKERLGQVAEPLELPVETVNANAHGCPDRPLTACHIEEELRGVVMTSKKALVRPASPRLAEGIVTHIERQALDYHLALKQWEGYVEAMEAAGGRSSKCPPPTSAQTGSSSRTPS